MKKILIIEDDQLAGNVFYNHLMAEGYHVKSAPDGESGLDLMRDFKPDVILLDLILPQMSGMEVIQQVRTREEFFKTPIVVFTNAYLTNLIQEAWKAGARRTRAEQTANSSPPGVPPEAGQTGFVDAFLRENPFPASHPGRHESAAGGRPGAG